MFVVLSHVIQYLGVLADPYCRRTLYYLSEQQAKPISLDTVAKHVTAFEVLYSPDTLVEADYAAVQQELRERHLPQLAAAGIIDFDPQIAVVRFQPPSHLFSALLRVSYLIERLA